MQLSIFVISWFICAFGQPAWSSLLSFLASLVGYAAILYLALQIPDSKKRFWLGASWFGAVQLVQFFWLLSHPFLYIYAVYVFLVVLYGAQFGLLCLWITPERLQRRLSYLVIPSFWVIMEWSRLFILSGTSWNPIGLTLAGNVYSMQAASLIGVLGLSFWVVLTALLLIHKSYYAWTIVAALPYIFGWAHITYHAEQIEKAPDSVQALLVQTAFPIEETLQFKDKGSYLRYVLDEWRKILSLTAPHQKEKFDFIALPEMVVPFGAYSTVYPYTQALAIFREVYGPDVLHLLPKPNPPFADSEKGPPFVNNAFFVQGLANIFDANILIGLEDAEYNPQGQREIYSGALLFRPDSGTLRWPPSERYEKRVLVPMGEYIPSAFLAELAKSYGIYGSFTPGTCAKVFHCGKLNIAPSVCYDDTYGNLIRECSANQANVLVNLTSDIWFPHSMLVWQHREHARLRTVEGGIPLFRACNTGITCAIDSLGRIKAELGTDTKDPEEIAAALPVTLPLYSYKTIYTQFGDGPLVGLSLFSLLFVLPVGSILNKNRRVG